MKIIKLNKKIIVIGLIIICTLTLAIRAPKTRLTSANAISKYHILVDVEESKMYVLQDRNMHKNIHLLRRQILNPIPNTAHGQLSKKQHGEKDLDGRWMGFNVPWGKFGIHGTTEPYSVGWASSHGCIRMKNDEVAELYKYIPHGTKVTIIDGPYGKFGKGFRELKSGMYGSDVQEIQKRLAELGFFYGTANGKFGSETEAAVERYCKANNLYVRKIIDVELQKHMGFVLMD